MDFKIDDGRKQGDLGKDMDPGKKAKQGVQGVLNLDMADDNSDLTELFPASKKPDPKDWY